jgi:malate-CoA ligase subunit beta
LTPPSGLRRSSRANWPSGWAWQARRLRRWATVLRACYRAFRDQDATWSKSTRLWSRAAGDLIALDAKMSFDTNALFRRPEVAALRDPGQEDPREDAAAEHGLSYVGLEGDIGCIINGAGPGDGHDGHDPACGRAACQLP